MVVFPVAYNSLLTSFPGRREGCSDMVEGDGAGPIDNKQL